MYIMFDYSFFIWYHIICITYLYFYPWNLYYYEFAYSRALARESGRKEGKEGDPIKRKEADAKALADKIAAKKAKEEAAAGGGGGGGGN